MCGQVHTDRLLGFYLCEEHQYMLDDVVLAEIVVQELVLKLFYNFFDFTLMNGYVCCIDLSLFVNDGQAFFVAVPCC